jgi:serine/threonine protein kinase
MSHHFLSRNIEGGNAPGRSSLYAGGELFDAIVEHCKQGKTYTEQHAAVIVAQVLRAVEHCHVKQVSG